MNRGLVYKVHLQKKYYVAIKNNKVNLYVLK